MRTKIKWAELHAPLFLAGTNLGQKLDHKTKGGVVMEYDEDKRHLYITYGLGAQAQTARVPETSVLSMIEEPTWKDKVRNAQKADTPTGAPGKPIEAQVETPQSHVFAGEGHGQTGQETPKGKGK